MKWKGADNMWLGNIFSPRLFLYFRFSELSILWSSWPKKPKVNLGCVVSAEAMQFSLTYTNTWIDSTIHFTFTLSPLRPPDTPIKGLQTYRKVDEWIPIRCCRVIFLESNPSSSAFPVFMSALLAPRSQNALCFHTSSHQTVKARSSENQFNAYWITYKLSEPTMCKYLWTYRYIGDGEQRHVHVAIPSSLEANFNFLFPSCRVLGVCRVYLYSWCKCFRYFTARSHAKMSAEISNLIISWLGFYKLYGMRETYRRLRPAAALWFSDC